VIKQLWTDQWRVKPLLDEYYVEAKVDGVVMWLRRDSPNIRWAEVARRGSLSGGRLAGEEKKAR
jgi:hypothetical protein